MSTETKSVEVEIILDRTWETGLGRGYSVVFRRGAHHWLIILEHHGRFVPNLYRIDSHLDDVTASIDDGEPTVPIGRPAVKFFSRLAVHPDLGEYKWAEEILAGARSRTLPRETYQSQEVGEQRSTGWMSEL